MGRGDESEAGNVMYWTFLSIYRGGEGRRVRAWLVCFWHYEERVHSDLPNTPEFWLVHDVLGEREVGGGVNLGLGEMFMGSGDPTRLGRGGGGHRGSVWD